MHGVSIDGESVDLVSVDSLFAALWAPSEDGTCAVLIRSVHNETNTASVFPLHTTALRAPQHSQVPTLQASMCADRWPEKSLMT